MQYDNMWRYLANLVSAEVILYAELCPKYNLHIIAVNIKYLHSCIQSYHFGLFHFREVLRVKLCLGNADGYTRVLNLDTFFAFPASRIEF